MKDLIKIQEKQRIVYKKIFNRSVYLVKKGKFTENSKTE